MLMPSIFGENLFDDFMDGFAFPTANWNYAKNTANVMKTDIKENDKGYELDVTDYLLKPISFDRFLKAVNKVHGLLQQEKWPDEANNFIFVRSDRQMHKVLFKDILVVEGLENYVCIYTESTKLLVRSTMKRMIEALPGGVFQQVHKSYLINLEKIEMIDGNRIIVGRHTVPVARNFREEVFARILKNTL